MIFAAGTGPEIATVEEAGCVAAKQESRVIGESAAFVPPWQRKALPVGSETAHEDLAADDDHFIGGADMVAGSAARYFTSGTLRGSPHFAARSVTDCGGRT
nr:MULTISPECIES: hypothetical protein [unclassified Mesorhizobium]